MPETVLPPWEKAAYYGTLLVSLVMLAIVLVIVPDRCGQGMYEPPGRFVCDIESGLFTFREAFCLLALYAVFKLYLERYCTPAPDAG